jgi:hypothetical protein
MWTADVVLLCALELLGRPASSFPPIEFVRSAPADASKGVEAYVGPRDGKIYLLTTGSSFQRLLIARQRCGDTDAARKLASVLIHEDAHIREGATERAAYEKQLVTLMMLGSNVGSPPYQETFRAMQHTLHRQKTPAAGLMAADRHPTRLP